MCNSPGFFGQANCPEAKAGRAAAILNGKANARYKRKESRLDGFMRRKSD
jgi:hypothetical protein